MPKFITRIPIFGPDGREITQADGWRSDLRKTVKQYAEQVLEAAGEPLHYSDIFEEMLELGYQTEGKTPLATLRARLTEASRDENSPITRAGRGIYEV